MTKAALITLISGIIMLILTIINGFTLEQITPSGQRSEVIAGLASVGLMLVAILWTEANPKPAERSELLGQNGLFIENDLQDSLKRELGWGSELILTATGAATILVFWNNRTLLKRGITLSSDFKPGQTTKSVINSGKKLSLVNTRFFPNKDEFNSIVKNLPSIILQPLSDRGVLIVGGWSERCFTQSGEVLIEGWARRLAEELIESEA